MEVLQFTIDIKALPERVWFVLWNEIFYRAWTKAFHESSFAKGEWREGGRIHFLTSEGAGMYADIKEMKSPEKMTFQYLGEISAFEELPPNPAFKDGFESYKLAKDGNGTKLTVTLQTLAEYAPMFSQMFPAALQLVKSLSEDFRITVITEVLAPVEKVWESWTLPSHIKQWNQASPEWHTPFATNHVHPGGKFVWRMEAKDGSMGFDFGGTYQDVEVYRALHYILDDNRKVSLSFEPTESGTLVTEQFEPESLHSLDLQYMGWNAILQSFKTYTEQH